MAPDPAHGVTPSNLQFIILAGSIREYYQYLETHGISRNSSLYAGAPSVFKTLQIDPKQTRTIVTPTFYMRPDAQQILNAARGSGAIC